MLVIPVSHQSHENGEDLPESIMISYAIPTFTAATIVGLQDSREGIWVFNKDDQSMLMESLAQYSLYHSK